MLPYLVLLRVGFAMPRDVVLARGALLPHRFTLTTHVLRRRSAVCSLLHCPSAHAAQALPGTVPYGARTFLEMLAHLATIRPTRRHCTAYAAQITPRELGRALVRGKVARRARS